MDHVPPQTLRFRRKGRPYVADVVERVRCLIVGTTWPEAKIADHVGIGVATVHGWKTRRGWQRPVDASLSTRKVSVSRAGFTRRHREAVRRLEACISRERERVLGESPPDVVRLRRLVAIAAASKGAQAGAARSRPVRGARA